MALIKLNNKAVSNATAFGSISSLGSMTFIKKLTASSSATLSFVDGSDGVVLDDTYKEYVFTYNNIHPANDGTWLLWQGSTDGGSSYGVTMTTTMFDAYHNEAGGSAALGYNGDRDQAQSTAFNYLTSWEIGNDNDQCAAGTLNLYNPSSTVFVKHFTNVSNVIHPGDWTNNGFSAGYFNTTSALNAFQFKMNSGNIDAGDICLYGIA